MDRDTEYALVRKAAVGDRSAAERLIREFQPGLYMFMVRFTGRHDIAEDVTQEAFVRVLRNLDRFDPRFRFSTWLFTIARRVFLNRGAKMRPLNSTDVGGHDLAACAPGAAHVAQSRATTTETRDAIQDALLDLPERQREVVVMFYLMGWSIRVIAELLDMPEGTIKSHLHRARRRLRTVMEQDESLRAAVEEAWA